MRSFQAHKRRAFLLAATLLVVSAAGAIASPSRHAQQATSPAQATSVEVINGTSRRVVTLRSDDAPTKAASTRHTHHARNARHHRRHRSAAPPPLTAEILNGNQKETRVFRGESATSAPHRSLSPVVIGIASEESKSRQDKPVVVGISSVDKINAAASQPVVVGVASSESHLQDGSSSQPVVVGVASSGAQAAGVVEPATVGVEPRPAKRPPYRPAKLDRQ
jgi:hypothetical protein